MKLSSRRPLSGHISLTAWFVALCLALPAGAQLCPFPADPIPAGPQGRTNEPYPNFQFDHRYDHSGTHLQGVRAREKWAGGLIHTPLGTNFAAMTGLVIVDNPDPNLVMNATIDFFDALGTNVGTVFRTIQPEGFAAVAATQLASTFGVGTARVTVTDNSPPLVGATLQHTTQFSVPVGGSTTVFRDGDRPLSTNNLPPGASSKQQLQKKQDTSSLSWVFPLSLISSVDFYVANLPWFHVINPTATANPISITLTVFDRVAGTVTGPIPWRSVTLPPFGSLTEITGPHLPALGTTNPGLFEFLVPLYSTPGLDFDVIVNITSTDGLPILGDGYMADVLGPAAPGGNAIRMTSNMMSSTPGGILTNPEFSYHNPTTGGIQQTLMMVANVGTVDAGPVTIQYFDNSNNLLNAFTVASLPPNQTLRIEPGALGYPDVIQPISGFGWARVIPCQSRLIGWSVRETLPVANLAQYHKAYGEALLNLNGAEPGPGFAVAAQNPIRKVSPLVRVDSTIPTFPWPGYTVAANLATANTGPYNWSFFTALGALCGFTPFPGLQFGNSSWTYEDPLTFCGGPINLSGRFDITTGEVEGLGILGDPLDEYGFPGFALPVPTYEGPGDVVDADP
ncbi:MAG: hypothetical protein AAF560_16855 [Acidobacteriota bacterium]